MRDHQGTALVVADLADAAQAIQDQAAVSARVAPNLVVGKPFVKRTGRPLLHTSIERLGERGRLFGRH